MHPWPQPRHVHIRTVSFFFLACSCTLPGPGKLLLPRLLHAHRHWQVAHAWEVHQLAATRVPWRALLQVVALEACRAQQHGPVASRLHRHVAHVQEHAGLAGVASGHLQVGQERWVIW